MPPLCKLCSAPIPQRYQLTCSKCTEAFLASERRRLTCRCDGWQDEDGRCIKCGKDKPKGEG